MLVKISCGRCKGPLMLDEDHIGRLVRCPACKNTFTARPPDPDEDEPVQLEVVPDDVDSASPPAAKISTDALQAEPFPPPRPRPVEQKRPELPRRSVLRRRPVP